MEKGIVYQGILPIRREPSETSEMVSQVLFGEEFRILDTKDKWMLISLDYDGIEGWVIRNCVRVIGSGNKAENNVDLGMRMVSQPFINVLDLTQRQQLILPTGSIWPNSSGKVLSLYGHEFEMLSENGLITPGPGIDPEEVGRGLVSLPHIWGGRSGFGFDGPGLVQMLCRMMGILLPRQCSQQAGLGITINFVHEIKKGDLAFFDNEEGEIVHVGMVLDKGSILHSAKDVRIDKFDLYGIYSIDKAAYTHKLRIVKRVKGEG